MKRYSVAICGGGSTYTPDMIELLCLLQDSFPLRRVVLYDIDAERQKIVGEFGRVMFRDYYEGLEFSYTTDPEKAFTDIDFAFVQIRAGGMGLRDADEKIPYRHARIGQETCGPGGLAYGVRSVVAMVDLVRDIRAWSPDAWIINYANPAAIVAEATKRAFPGDKRLVSICDMPPDVLNHYLPYIGKKRSDVRPVYFGLNHYGWFSRLLDRKTGKDILPELLGYILDNYDALHAEFESRITGPEDHWPITFLDHLEMIRDYPYSLPNTYNLYYLYPDRTYAHYSVKHTRYDEVIEGREKQVFSYCRRVAELGHMAGTEYDIADKIAAKRSSIRDLGVETVYSANDVHAAYLVELVISIINNANEPSLVMVENNGICSNLDSGMMLEAACLVGSQELQPLQVGTVPTFEKGLLENQYACEKLLVDAIFEQSDRKLLQAFVENRLVYDTDTAKAIIRDFKVANGRQWPEFK